MLVFGSKGGSRGAGDKCSARRGQKIIPYRYVFCKQKLYARVRGIKRGNKGDWREGRTMKLQRGTRSRRWSGQEYRRDSTYHTTVAEIKYPFDIHIRVRVGAIFPARVVIIWEFMAKNKNTEISVGQTLPDVRIRTRAWSKIRVS